MTANLPLADLTIVVTRPREQAAGLVQHIEQLGGKPVLFPLLEIEAVRDDSILREQVSRVSQTDLVIFISPNAVRFGLAAITTALSPSPSPACGRGVRDSAGEGVVLARFANLRIATVGQGSAKALQEAGVAQVIAPKERFDSEGLLALPELQDIAGKRVMIFRGDGGRELLGDTLKARGASVEYVTCYLRGKPALDAGALIAAAPDAITVTSSEALGHLSEMLGAAGKTRLANVPLFVPHRRIGDAAGQQGWQQVFVTESGDDGLLSGLIAWAHTKRKMTR